MYDKVLSRIEEIILSLTIILMATILVGNVIDRTVFHQSWPFAEEVGQFLLIILTFVGISYAARTGQHIRMSAFYGMFSQKVRRVIMIIISATTSVAMFTLGYYGVRYVIKLYTLGSVSPALRWPMYIIMIFVPLGLFLCGIEYARATFKNIKYKEVYISASKIDNLYEQ